MADKDLVAIPRRLAEEIRRRGMDLGEAVLEALSRYLDLSSEAVAEVKLELVKRYFEDGVRLVDRDPVAASAKLYKAAEECVKALAERFKLKEILARVRVKGRWTPNDLEEAVRVMAKGLGSWLLDSWDHAWALYVWGFHEARLGIDAVRVRVPYIERLVRETMEMMGMQERYAIKHLSMRSSLPSRALSILERLWASYRGSMSSVARYMKRNIYSVYRRGDWGAPFIIAFIVMLLVSAALLAMGYQGLANEVAVYAYYYLVIGVVLQLAAYIIRERRGESS